MKGGCPAKTRGQCWAWPCIPTDALLGETKAEMGGLYEDVRKAGEEEDWKKKTIDRGGWRRLSDEAVKKLRAAPRQ